MERASKSVHSNSFKRDRRATYVVRNLYLKVDLQSVLIVTNKPADVLGI